MRTTVLAAVAASALLSASAVEAQIAATPQDGMRAQILATQAALRARWADRVAHGLVPASGTEPSLTSGKVLTPTVDVTKAPGLPELQLTINTGTIGLYNGQVTLTSPSGSHTQLSVVNVPMYPPAPGKYVLKVLLSSFLPNSSGIGLYAAAGTWSIANITLSSMDGQSITYNSTQIAALFSGPAAVNIVNPGTPDTAPPVAGHGKIATPTVSLSSPQPYAVVKLSASDNLSGINYASVTFAAPGANFPAFGVSASFDAPTLKGNFTLFDLLPATLATGSYNIVGYSLCDYAGNCVSDTTPAGIAAHFDKTTIEVTQ